MNESGAVGESSAAARPTKVLFDAVQCDESVPHSPMNSLDEAAVSVAKVANFTINLLESEASACPQCANDGVHGFDLH